MEGLSDSSHQPSIEGDLWSRHPRPYDDVIARSSAVDLSEHLSDEDVERLSQEAAALGIPDAGKFLRAEVVRLGDIQEVDETAQQVQLPDFIAQVLSAASDGVYS